MQQQPECVGPKTRLLPYLSPNLTGQPLPRPRHPLTAPTKTGQAFTFGSAVSGELGLGKTVQERRKPGNIRWLNGKNIVAVECGGQHVLALDQQGRVWSWGINDQGALGRRTSEDEMTAAQRLAAMDEDSSEDEDDLKGNEAWVPNLVDIQSEDGRPVFVVQMVCADSFSAVLSSEGHVYAWGSFRDPSGVIGFSKQMAKQSQRLPARIEAFGTKKVVLLGSGENHVFAVTDDDTLWAFGANDENQLGRRVSSRFKNNLEPYEIRGLAKRQTTLHHIIKIVGGAYHTLYINSGGELYAFGCNNCGQLGLGDTFPHINGPEKVEFYIAEDGKSRKPLPPIVDIAAGESHSLAASADGRLFTWGANLEGQLGYEMDRPVYGDERDDDSPRRAEGRRESRRHPDGDEEMDTTPTPSVANSAQTSPEKPSVMTRRQSNAQQLAEHLHVVGETKLGPRSNYKLMYQPLPRVVPHDGRHGLPPTSQDSIIMVSAQSRYSLAVSALGGLYTWGSGHCYQLGNEEMDDETTPFHVQLKNRICYWARCAGQFVVFLLEPKREQDEDGPFNLPVNPGQNQNGGAGSRRSSRSGAADKNSSVPSGSQYGSTESMSVYPNGFADGFSRYRIEGGADPAPSSLPNSPFRSQVPGLKTSPMLQSPLARGKAEENTSLELMSAFDSVCVSPERKRNRLESDAVFTAEQRMAPWSPKKSSTASTPFNSPPPAAQKRNRGARNLMKEIMQADDQTDDKQLRQPLTDVLTNAESIPTQVASGEKATASVARTGRSKLQEEKPVTSRSTRSRRH